MGKNMISKYWRISGGEKMGEYGSQTDILEQRGERGFRKKLKRK
jgi:hypothetical protein